LTLLVDLGMVLTMMHMGRKLAVGAGSFAAAAGITAVLLGSSGVAASGHSTGAARPASHQRVTSASTDAAAVGLTLSVAPAPVKIAVQPKKVTLTSTTKPKKVTKSTDPAACPGMGGSSTYDPSQHHGGGKP
jgi:hypothetical protein